MSKSMIVDLEVENHKHLGSLASPFHPENYIVAPAFAIDNGPVHDWYFLNRAEADSSDWFTIPDDVSVLVAHNATFELHWFMHRHWDELLKFLKRGGRIFCTQYAEYLLSGQIHTYPALDEVAPKYGGTTKIDAVKLLWEEGYLTSQIDQALLTEYLAGPGGDIENTRRVYFGQYAALTERNMLEMFWLRMDSLLHNAFCTFFGLHIDVPLARKNLEEQLIRVAELKTELELLLPPDLPTELRADFNWGSDYHVSALLFGGPINYDARVLALDDDGQMKYEKQEAYIFADGSGYYPVTENTIPDDDIAALLVRYKAGKNKGALKIEKIDSTVPKTKWGKLTYQFTGIIDIDQMPDVLRTKYRGKHAEFVGKRFLSDGTTPVYSTGGDSLEALVLHGYTAVKPMTELASLEKDNGTYYEAFDYNKDGTVKKHKGMLQYVDPETSIIHHQLNGTSTVTGRLSSSNPNLQNLPRDGTSKVKQMFTSRFEGGNIIEVDYTALEVVTLAAIAGDQNLLQRLIDGTDMHTYRLAGKLKRSYEELLAILHDKEHPEHKTIKQARTDIKPPSFAAQYGASAAGIAYATGCSVEYAEEFLALEASLFPQSIAFREVIRNAVEASSSNTGNICREENEYGGWSVYRRGQWVAPGGTMYNFRQYKQWRDGQEVMDFKPTQLANYWCQGEASFIVQVACGLVIRWFIQNDFFNGDAVPVNTVHDAQYTDSKPYLTQYVGNCIKQIMEYAPKLLAEKFGYPYANVPFPAAAEAGNSMYEKEHVQPL